MQCPRRGDGEGEAVHCRHADQLRNPSPEAPETQRKPSHRWHLGSNRDQSVYGAKHRRLRRQVLAEEPDCRQCGAPAQIADHVKPVCLGGETKRENYQGLCGPCSRSKSGREGAHIRWIVNRQHMDRGHG